MKILTFGEIMLRLKSPEHLRIVQTDGFEASYGGAESNVSVSLATLGNDAAFLTKLPKNPVGDAAFNELRRFAHPKYVRSLKLDGKVVSEPVVRSVTVYFSVIIGIIIVSIILVSANGFDFESSLSAVFACIFNIGPGFHAFGPTASFTPLSNFSKLVLTFDMLAGRLELWPLLLLFVPSTWKKRAVYK